MKVTQGVNLRVEEDDHLLVTETDHGNRLGISMHGCAHRHDGFPDWGIWSIDFDGRDLRQHHIDALAMLLNKLSEEFARQQRFRGTVAGMHSHDH